MARRPQTPVRIDQDLYDFFVEYAKNQEGYTSAAQIINTMLRQAVRAVGIAESADEKYNKDASKG